MTRPIVLAGGGLAAQRCAETLRRRGHDGPIVIVCGESQAPYDRPPLSKEFLAGEAHTLRFRPDEWYADHDVELELGAQASGIEDRRLVLADGRRLAFERLLIATGADARPFPGAPEGVLTLRTRADAQRLRDVLAPGAHLVIVGGGLIGLEVAATATALGAQATVVERGPAPMSTVLGLEAALRLKAFHRARGVEVLTGAEVLSVDARGVILADFPGLKLEADAVLVAIGGRPATRWLGLPHGIRVDHAQRTDLPHVLAAGDCVQGSHDHWESAARQGTTAACTMLGLAAPKEPPASFWSDQHGVRLHVVGDPSRADALHSDGDLADGDATVTYARDGRPVAVLLAGRGHELPAARRLLSTPTLERSAA